MGKGRGGVQNNGSGTLVLPSHKIGDKLIKWMNSRSHKITVNGTNLRLHRSPKFKTHLLQVAQTLEKTPYLDPDIEEEREKTLHTLDVGISVAKVQFGVYYRALDAKPSSSRTFSNEYDISYRDKSAGIVSFEYEHKLIRIEVRLAV